MQTIWTAHLKDLNEIQRFESSVLSSKGVLNRLIEIIKNKEDSIENVELSLEAYDKPNWAERQAHINGYKSCIKRILKIINLDPKEDR